MRRFSRLDCRRLTYLLAGCKCIQYQRSVLGWYNNNAVQKPRALPSLLPEWNVYVHYLINHLSYNLYSSWSSSFVVAWIQAFTNRACFVFLSCLLYKLLSNEPSALVVWELKTTAVSLREMDAPSSDSVACPKTADQQALIDYSCCRRVTLS